MATTKNGNPSAKHPHFNMTWKRALKIEKIARLSIDPAGYSNEQIANFLGCDKQTVVLIRQLPEYHAKMLEVSSGVTSAWDIDVRTDYQAMRDEMRANVPSAMMVIRNSLFSKNPNIALKAAMEVMDREGTLAKVSKTSVAVSTVPHMALDASVASNLMALLAGAPPSAGAAGTIAATGADFTISAGAAAIQQGAMATEADALEALDSIPLPPERKPN
jgi:hypothetical protein